jgi:hypothetical protein
MVRTQKRSRNEPSVYDWAESACAQTCRSCQKALKNLPRVYFVEENPQKIFCSEQCIQTHYAPLMGQMVEEYQKLAKLSPQRSRSPSKHEVQRLLDLPDEHWMFLLPQGPEIHVWIANQTEARTPTWLLALTLCIKGAPSYLLVSFATTDAVLLEKYKRGEKQMDPIHMIGEIRAHEFEQYDQYFDRTLHQPDEVWSMEEDEGRAVFQGVMRYHFLRFYPSEKEDVPFWYYVVAIETEKDDELEVLEARPTRDMRLIEALRIGHAHATKHTSEVTKISQWMH